MTGVAASDQPIRVLCFGAGAIGAYIGGSLALAGNRVVFLETPQAAQVVAENGLRMEINGEVRKIKEPIVVAALDEALAHGPFDCAILALKSYDTHALVESLLARQDKIPSIVCLQNGVMNEPYLVSIFGADRVIPGTVTSAIGRRGAGDIVLERLRGVGIAANHPLSNRLLAAFNAAGLNARLYRSAADMKWSKLLTNLPANASSAILDLTPAEIFSNRELFRQEIYQLREALGVMRKQNIRVVDLPGTPVRLFAFAIRWLPLPLAQRVLRRAIGGGRGAKMPSFHIDLHNRRGKSEVIYLNGAVADFGEQLNIPTPVNRFLTDTLMALTQEKLPVLTYARQPQKFINDLERITRSDYSTTP